MTAVTASPRRLLITRRLPDPVIDRARALFDTEVWPHDAPIGDALTAAARGKDALLVMANDRIDAPLLRALTPGLRAVATYSAGYDHIDLAAASALSVPVFFAPDTLHHAVAEVALYLILAAARRTRSAEAVLREGRWGLWSPTAMLGTQLTGRRLGIYGMGAIGREIAVRARAFGMAIHYHNRRPAAAGLAGNAAYHATLDDLVAVSDILCVAAPSSDETRGSIDRRRLLLLPAGATIVNIARGDLIDEAAMLDLAEQGRIGPLALDVYRNEPAIDPRFHALSDAVLLPHIGSATETARVAMGMRALDGLAGHFAGGRPSNILNPQVRHEAGGADPLLSGHQQ